MSDTQYTAYAMDAAKSVPRLENCGTYFAKDNQGRWHYINHAGEWCGFQGFEELELRDALAKAEARVKVLEEALRWYEQKVTDCRKITPSGDAARSELHMDGGSKARAALQVKP